MAGFDTHPLHAGQKQDGPQQIKEHGGAEQNAQRRLWGNPLGRKRNCRMADEHGDRLADPVKHAKGGGG